MNKNILSQYTETEVQNDNRNFINNITIISDCVEYLNYIKEKYGKLFLYSCKCK